MSDFTEEHKHQLITLHQDFVSRYGGLWTGPGKTVEQQQDMLQDLMSMFQEHSATPQELGELREWVLSAMEYQDAPPKGGQLLKALLDLRQSKGVGEAVHEINRQFKIRFKHLWVQRKLHSEAEQMVEWQKALSAAGVSDRDALTVLRSGLEGSASPPTVDEFIRMCKTTVDSHIVYLFAIDAAPPGFRLSAAEEDAMRVARRFMDARALRENPKLEGAFVQAYHKALLRGDRPATPKPAAPKPLSNAPSASKCPNLTARLDRIVGAL